MAAHVVATVLFVFVVAHVVDKPSRQYLILAGVLFATHPIHCEAVAGLVGRADVLAACFFLAALLLYFHACAAVVLEKQLAFVAATVAAVGLSVLCKETGITVVAVATVYDMFLVQRIDLHEWVGLPAPARDESTATSDDDSGVAGGVGSTTSKDLPAGSFGLRFRGRTPRAESSSDGVRSGTAAKRTTAVARKSTSHMVMRLGLLWSCCIAVLILRLRMNTQDIQVDAKTNPANHITDTALRWLTKNLYGTPCFSHQHTHTHTHTHYTISFRRHRHSHLHITLPF